MVRWTSSALSLTLSPRCRSVCTWGCIFRRQNQRWQRIKVSSTQTSNETISWDMWDKTVPFWAPRVFPVQKDTVYLSKLMQSSQHFWKYFCHKIKTTSVSSSTLCFDVWFRLWLPRAGKNKSQYDFVYKGRSFIVWFPISFVFLCILSWIHMNCDFSWYINKCNIRPPFVSHSCCYWREKNTQMTTNDTSSHKSQ